MGLRHPSPSTHALNIRDIRTTDTLTGQWDAVKRLQKRYVNGRKGLLAHEGPLYTPSQEVWLGVVLEMKGKSVTKHRENTSHSKPVHAPSRSNLRVAERLDWDLWEKERLGDLEEVRSMARLDRMQAIGLLEQARQKTKELRAADNVPVELQVVDVRHARSAEVLSFCLSHLGGGGTWGALRNRLGLGPGDIRWKLIRERAIEGLLPVNEEEAIKAVGSQRSFLVDKLEIMLEDLEGRINMMSKTESTFDHYFWKLKLEAMKLLLEENSKQLSDHLDVKRAKAADRHSMGVSIVVQNSFYIPRPGDGADRIADVVPIINELAEKAKELEELVNPEKL